MNHILKTKDGEAEVLLLQNNTAGEHILQLGDYIKGLETDNKDLKTLVKQLQDRKVTDERLIEMQGEVEELLTKGKSDQHQLKLENINLKQRLDTAEMELRTLQLKSSQEHDFLQRENLRKDEALDNLQTSFTIVLKKIIAKVRACMDSKAASMTYARLQGSLEEVLDTMEGELHQIENFFGETGQLLVQKAINEASRSQLNYQATPQVSHHSQE